MTANVNDCLNYLPSKLCDSLLPFQKDGVKYGIEKNGCLLIADEMGLGKTLQALCVAYRYREDWPMLVVAPASMRYPWVEEIEKWLPDIDPRRIRLIQSQVDINEINAEKVDIVVMSYGIFSNAKRSKDRQNFYRSPIVEAMFRASFQVVILDESHYVKNPKARRTENLIDIVKRAKRRILLTGTPALARPEELFSQVDAILPGSFGTWPWYSKQYCNAHMRFFGKRRQWDTSGASNLEELQAKLTSRLMIRRLKAEVLTQLPPKTRQRIPFDVSQSKFKRDIESTWKELGAFLNKNNINVSKAMRMVQVRTDEDKDEGPVEGQKTIRKSCSEKHFIRQCIIDLARSSGMAKVGAVVEYLRLLLQNPQEKFLVFAHHKCVVEGLAIELTKMAAEFGGFKIIRIDGGVPVELRAQLVQNFQSDPNVRVALLSIMAAGTGLTFTAGSHVVFAELHWTPGVLQQCEDRVHRIGQRRVVHIHYLVARDSIDDWFWSALTRKTQVVSLALNGETQTLNPNLESNVHKLNRLTNAATWIPPEEPEFNSSSEFFEKTQMPEDQSFITDFFHAKPKENPKRDKFWKTGQLREKLQDSDIDQISPTKKRKRSRVALIDVPSDEETDFLSQSREDKRRRILKNRNRKRVRGSEIHTAVKLATEDALKTSGKGAEVTNRWACEQCTFLNRPINKTCEICGGPQDGSQVSKYFAKTSPVQPQPNYCVSNDAASSSPSPKNEDVTVELLKSYPVPNEKNKCFSQILMTSTPARRNEKQEDFDKSFGRKEASYIEIEDSKEQSLISAPSCSAKVCENGLKFFSLQETESIAVKNPEIPVEMLDSWDESTEALSTSQKELSIPTDATLSETGLTTHDADRRVDLDQVVVIARLLFFASRNTDRVYVYDSDANSLHINFLPLDVETENWSEIPDSLLHPTHLRQLRVFVREWHQLTETKRRMIRKSGEIFRSPKALYDDVAAKREHCVVRKMDVADLARAASSKAAEIGGSTRTLLPKNRPRTDTNCETVDNNRNCARDGSGGGAEVSKESNSLVQAVDADGAPLCLLCHSAIQNALPASMESREDVAWDTRFCRRECREEFLLKRAQSTYIRKELLLVEKGICQLCGVNAHELYAKVKEEKDPLQRMNLIKNSIFNGLRSVIKNRMVTKPTAGDFWQADHHLAVVEGGGQCDIGNFRTLCTVCHAVETKKLMERVRKRKKLQKAALSCGDLKDFYKPI